MDVKAISIFSVEDLALQFALKKGDALSVKHFVEMQTAKENKFSQHNEKKKLLLAALEERRSKNMHHKEKNRIMLAEKIDIWLCQYLCKECYNYKISKEFYESPDFFVYTATANNNALKYRLCIMCFTAVKYVKIIFIYLTYRS